MKPVFLVTVECWRCGKRFVMIGMSTCPRCKKARS